MQTILITGASRGIGLAATKLFLDKGAVVIGTSTSGDIQFHHESLHTVKLDLASPKSIQNAVERIKEITPSISILINNAGIRAEDMQTTLVINLLEKTLAVNLIGTANFTENILPLIEKGGSIMTISSEYGSMNDPVDSLYSPAYRISKAAVNMYTKVLANKIQKDSISVISVDPGWVRTDMGGSDAPRSAEGAAFDLYTYSTMQLETGSFYREGKKRSW